jgi:hypothetical protein
MKNMAKVILVCCAFLGCLGLLSGDAAAKMYDDGGSNSMKSAAPSKAPCGTPPPMICGPYPYGPYIMVRPRGRYGTYLDDTRKGVGYFDISGGM